MANLQAKYMGIELKNPVIAGASELSSQMSSIKKIEEAGIGAIVIKSLFEEQIQLEKARFEEEQIQYDGVNAEMTSIYPTMHHSGPEEHLMWVRRAKESTSIPIIASLNAVNTDTWIKWAKKLEDTGVDGIELNFFANPELQEGEGAAIERNQVSIVAEVVSNVEIPVSIKMSLFYTTPLSVAKSFARAGARGLVLFNRFFQPDIDAKTETALIPLNLSASTANRLPLRYAGLLFEQTDANLCVSSGIMDGLDVAKMILAGADVVQVVSTLYRNKITQVGRIVDELDMWMDEKGYASLDAFRGKMSKKNSTDPWVYKRAQYAKLLMKPDPMKIIR